MWIGQGWCRRVSERLLLILMERYRQNVPPSPVPRRPFMPDYGVLPAEEGSGLLAWERAESQMRRSMNLLGAHALARRATALDRPRPRL